VIRRRGWLTLGTALLAWPLATQALAAGAPPEAAAAFAAGASPEAAAAFAAGRVALDTAARWSAESRQALRDAAALRRALLARRGGSAADADADAARLEALQRDGALARDNAEAARREAAAHFARGLALGWPQWVHNTAPLTMDSDLQQALLRATPSAHNARLRSVHPDMPPPAATAASAPLDEAFTLQFPMLASQNPPRDLDIASFQLSRDARFVAHVEVDADAGTGSTGGSGVASVPLNRLHRWRLLVSDLHGTPVSGARIDVTGHMPGHVHGLPTQPRVTAEIAPGVYRVEGMKFQMDGWWVMQFEIHPTGGDPAAQASDNVAFNLVF
jgi:hypothetical protein